MSYSCIFRAGLSCSKRVPSTSSILKGICSHKWNGSVYPKQIEALSRNQSLNYCEDVKSMSSLEQRLATSKAEIDRLRQENSSLKLKLSNKKKNRSEIDKKRLIDGKSKLPAPRAVTSLPVKPILNGDEEFIVVNALACNFGHFMIPLEICAVSSTANLRLVFKPEVKLHPSLEMISKLTYDADKGQVLQDGQPVETVERKEGMKQFLDFVKGHKHPVLISYSHHSAVRLELICRNLNVGEELNALVPYKFQINNMLKTILQEPLDLETVAKSTLDLDISDANSLERAEVTLRLFTKHILPQVNANDLISMDYYWAYMTYAELVTNKDMSPLDRQKLARKGVGLDHLKFLSNKGIEEFKQYLLERNLSENEINVLYTVLSK